MEEEIIPDYPYTGWFLALAFLMVLGGIVLIWRSQTLGHERRLRTIEGCQTISNPIAKTDCYTGDVWE